MPGLLDNLQADDTIKDEFGQTQADRRQPLWSGLIKAGLLGVAAGGDLMPSERAKMVGQMGGAIGDIPNDMMQYRAGAAQQTLRGQQIATAKTKLDNIAKLQALAKSPEFLDSIKDLKPHEKIAMQAAIDAGDIDAFAKITGQVGTSQYKDQQLLISQGRLGIADERLKLEQEKAAAKAADASGWGNTLEGRMRDQLSKGKADPEYAKTDKYAEAWHYFNQDQRPVQSGGQTIILPKRTDLPDYPTPGAKPAAGSPSATQPPQEPPPKEGEPRQNKDGSVTWVDPATKEVNTEFADGTMRVEKDGRFVRSERPKPIPEAAQKELAEYKGTQAQIKVASQAFLDEWRKAEGTDRLKALGGFNTPLNRAWRNVALIAKGKALYELGVLNVGDLPQLQKALADPSSVTSAFATEQSVEGDLKAMMDLMQAKIGGTEKALHEQRLRRPNAGGGGGGGGTGDGAKPVKGADGVWRLP